MRSLGLELEGSFAISKSWQVTAAYSYIDARITEDNVLPVGARLAGVPEHSFNIWSKYDERFKTSARNGESLTNEEWQRSLN